MSRPKPKKTQRRELIISSIMDALQADVVYKTIDYRNKPEIQIKQYLHQPFIARLEKLHRALGPTPLRENDQAQGAGVAAVGGRCQHDHQQLPPPRCPAPA